MKRALRALLCTLVVLSATTVPVAVLPSAQAAGTATISGTVTVPAGYDVRAVQVVAVPTGDPTVLGSVPTRTWVQPNGTFQITGVPAGTYNIAFPTYWSDMYPCSYGRDRWWTSPGLAQGVCTAGALTDAGVLTVADGAAVDLGTTPILTSIPVHRTSGTVAAPPGHTTAGLKVELWLEDEGAWLLPGGWYRLSSVPAQTLTANGAFSFDLVEGPWGHKYALRFVDEPANGYAFSFANGGLTSTTSGQTDFGVGSIGLIAVPQTGADNDLGSRSLKFEVGYASGGVTVTGTPEWGRTLTAHSTVAWSDPAAGTTFQWYRNGVALDGATTATYVLDAMDDGFESELSVRAVPTGWWAYNGTPISSPTLVIENTTPLNVGAPVVTGTRRVGALLTAGTGSWRPTAATYTYSYRWFRGTAPIPGATAATYRPVPADLGARLSVEVTATGPDTCSCNPWFAAPGVARSGAAPISAGTIPAAWITSWPTKATKAKVGKKARVTPLALTPAGAGQRLAVRYQWYVGGKAVKGATRTVLRLKKSARHRTVKLRVTVSKPGYAPVARTVSFGKAR